jgi:hypothetical protein
MNTQQQYKPFTVEQLGLKESDKTRLLGAIEARPLTLDGVAKLVPPVPTIMVNGTLQDISTYITLGELIDSLKNERITQRSIDPVRVTKVLIGDATAKIPGIVLLKDGVDTDGNPLVSELLEPIVVGVYADGEYLINSGRHRLTAILTYAKLSGIDVSSHDFRDTKIRVVYDAYSPRKVIAANSTRRVRKSEGNSVFLQENGVSPDDMNSILNAFTLAADSKSPIRPANLFIAFFGLAMDRQENEGKLPPILDDLSPETIADIAGQVCSKFAAKYPGYKEGFKYPDWMQNLLKRAYLGLPSAIASVKAAHITNIARAAGTVANAIVFELPVGREDGIPKPPEKEVKVKAVKVEAEAEVGKDKSPGNKGRVTRVSKKKAEETADVTPAEVAS